MTAKEYLNQYRKITTKIKLLELDIESLEAGIGSLPVPSDMPHTPSGRNTTEDILIDLVDMKNEKAELLAEARVKAAEISGTIELLAGIEDKHAAIYMQLLYDRYILLMSWPDVAGDINYADQYTRGELHGKALLAIECLLL